MLARTASSSMRCAVLDALPTAARSCRSPRHCSTISRHNDARARSVVVRWSAQQQDHNELQAQVFSDPEMVRTFTAPMPPEIEERLQVIAQSPPGLGPASRIIDVGAGTGCLIPHYRARGVADVLAVDLAAPMLEEVQKRYGTSSTLGNDPGVRTWCGDFLTLPAYMGPADCVVLNAVLGNFLDHREVLMKAASLLRPGGCVVLSHPLGRAWHTRLHGTQQVHMVPSLLPDEHELQRMVRDLPLEVLTFRDEEELYLVVLQVPQLYRFPGAPVLLEGPVVTGFGRGSRQLGIPTANIDPVPLQDKLATLPQGVYFGWAQLQAPDGMPADDGGVHKMVMNIGRRPTVEAGQGGGDLTVEAHILHKYSSDFYGCHLRCVALGYIRPETKFAGIPELVRRIRTDIGIAASTLAHPDLDQFSRDASLFRL